MFGANVNAVGGGGDGRFNPVFETSASHFGASNNTDRIRIFYDVDNIEPIMLDTAGVRNIATADPDSTATTSTFTVTGFNTNASDRVISIDYVLAGTEDTITLTTSSTTAKASSNATTIGTSDVTSATHFWLRLSWPPSWLIAISLGPQQTAPLRLVYRLLEQKLPSLSVMQPLLMMT